MAGYDAEIRVNTTVDTSQMQRLEIQIQRASNRVNELTDRMEELRNQRIPTEQYTQLQTSLQNAQAELERIIAEEEHLSDIGLTFGAEWDDIIDREATARLEVEEITAQMQALDEAGRAFTLGEDTDEFRRMSEELQLAQAQLRMLNTRHDELINRQNEIQEEQRDCTRGWDRLADAGKRALEALRNRTKSGAGMLKNMSSRLKSLALGLLVFNQISKGFNALTNAVQKGLKSLEEYYDVLDKNRLAGDLEEEAESYNDVVKEFRESCNMAHNALATAFAPVITHVLPYVTQLINVVTEAGNALSRFFAILSGKTSYTKALAGSLDDVAGSAQKAKRALAGFDELNVLQDNASGGGSGGGGGNLFEEVDVGAISDYTQKLKDAINAGDWYGVGALLAQKLNEALANINWEGIKAKAKEIAANIADFLNGGLETTDWYLVGATIGEGLNTGLTFLDTFAATFHWESLGSAIAKGINGFFDITDFELAASTINNISHGLLTSLDTAIIEIDWKEIGDSIHELFAKIEWKTLFEDIGVTALDAFIAAIKLAGGVLLGDSTLGEYFETGMEDILAKIYAKRGKTNTGNISQDAQTLEEIQSALDKYNSLYDKAEKEGLITDKDLANAKKFAELLLGETGDEIWNLNKKEIDDAYTDLLVNIGNSKEALDIGKNIYPDAMGCLSFPNKGNELQSTLEELSTVIEKWWNNELSPWFEPEKWSELGQGIQEGISVKWTEVCDWWDEAIGGWWDSSVAPWFGAEKWTEVGEGIEKGISAKWTEFNVWWDSYIGEWWDSSVAPWFTADKWSEVGQGIEDGISAKWAEFSTWWGDTALAAWWEESVAPWFTIEKWSELGRGIQEGISAEWIELCTWWDSSITAWWEENVFPWFTAEKWEGLGQGMKQGIYAGFKGVVKLIVDVLNNVLSSLENLMNLGIAGFNAFIDEIGGSKLGEKLGFDFTVNPVKFGRVPYLANGAVIRGGNPFLAFLGDQPAGQTNIEAPLSTIQQALKNVMSEYGGGAGTINLTLELDGREVYNRMIQLDQQTVMSTGLSGFARY